MKWMGFSTLFPTPIDKYHLLIARMKQSSGSSPSCFFPLDVSAGEPDSCKLRQEGVEFCYNSITVFFFFSFSMFGLCAKNYTVMLAKITLNHLLCDNLWLGHSSILVKGKNWKPRDSPRLYSPVIRTHICILGGFYAPGQCIFTGLQEGEISVPLFYKNGKMEFGKGKWESKTEEVLRQF